MLDFEEELMQTSISVIIESVKTLLNMHFVVLIRRERLSSTNYFMPKQTK